MLVKGDDIMEIIYSKAAVKTIKSMDTNAKQRIKAGIEGLVEVHPKGDIKQMQGIEPIIFRLRIGKYRVLFEYIMKNEEKFLFIKDIGSRGDVYK